MGHISIKAIFQEQEKIRQGIMISKKEKQETTWDHILPSVSPTSFLLPRSYEHIRRSHLSQSRLFKGTLSHTLHWHISSLSLSIRSSGNPASHSCTVTWERLKHMKSD